VNNFIVHKPTFDPGGSKAGPPIVKIMTRGENTVLYFTVAIRRTLDIIEGAYHYDKTAHIVVLVDQDEPRLAIMNSKPDDEGALQVSGVRGSSTAYVNVGDLGTQYKIPDGRYEAHQEFIRDGDLEKGWIVDLTKNLGPGKAFKRGETKS
jgi:hypothetical protein